VLFIRLTALNKHEVKASVSSGNSKLDEQKVLQRLSGRTTGLTTRDLARLLGVRPSEANEALLNLQSKGKVSLRGVKWFSVHTNAVFGNNIHAPFARSKETYQRTTSESLNPYVKPHSGLRQTNDQSSQPVDRRQSRWTIFRRLCDYYAECVRLDQRSSITATASEEFESIVCLDGAIPNSNQIHIRTRESWHKWVRKLAEDEYLFLGYPIQRYRWRNTEKGEDIDFISPVFIQPFRVKIDRLELDLQAIGSIRINEGWLERRLKNVEERRVFLELCQIDSSSDDDVNATSWTECARLISHFYPDWCAERLDTSGTSSTPSLESITRDGIYNRACLIIPRKWKYTGSLYKELISLANEIPDDQLDGTSLVYFFPHQPTDQLNPTNSEASTDALSNSLVGSQVLQLNHEQMLAAKAASKCNLSIIVGPPGTGKSRVVAAALAQQAIMDKSALFASKNHQALEAVVPRINAISEPWPIMIRLARPWGAPADMSLHAAISQLVSRDHSADKDHLNNVKKALSRRIADHAGLSAMVEEVGNLRDSIQKRMFELNELLRDVPEDYRDIALFGVHALPNINEIKNAFSLLAETQAARWSYQWFINLIFSRQRMRKGVTNAAAIDNVMRSAFDKQEKLPTVGTGNLQSLASFYRKVLEFWNAFAHANEVAILVNTSRRNLELLPTTDDICRREQESAKEVETLSIECFQELAKQTGAEITNVERCALANILASIENRSALDSDADHRRWADAMRKAFPVFLKHFPLAATTNLSIKRDIDLQPGMFDLLVIDEASQCDVASVIPLLFRVKRALIVGDPMQLSHVTSLSSATDRHLRRQFGVDDLDLERYSYRTASMFHLANTSASVESRVSLRQHHRCHPSIAAYCSETYYKGSWTILTQDTGTPGLEWTDIADDSVAAPGGGAISQSQLNAICSEVKRLHSENFKGSLGIVTPFRQQANRIRDALHEALPNNFITTSNLLVDTADGFQGDERDLVLFSLVAGESLPEGAWNFLANGPNRFNVAVSRAKQQLHVFGDLTWARNSTIRHIKLLAVSYDRECAERSRITQTGFRDDLVGPVWEPALANAMRLAGLQFYQQYPACGRFLDFALFQNKLKLNVEVDGETYHRSGSGDRVLDDIRRDQALIASGWTVIRFWVYELREDLSGCVAKISELLANSCR
jgi:very-short-patch-repair endonuclease